MSDRVESRKRSREDENSDSMPLSKRINNLHLTNQPNLNGQSVSLNGHGVNGHNQDVLMAGDRPHNDHHSSHLMTNGQSHQHTSHDHQQHSNNHHHQHHHSQGHVVHHNGQSSNHQQEQQIQHQGHQDAAGYNPELNQSTNPHYYQKNKLLYELHFIRSRKCHPDNS